MIRCEPCNQIIAFNDDQTKLTQHNYWHHSTAEEVMGVYYDAMKTLGVIKSYMDAGDWVATYPHISKVSVQMLFIEKYVTAYISRSLIQE